jgi:hypothetical protein
MINSKSEIERAVFFLPWFIHTYTHISGYLNFKLAFTITSVVIVIKKKSVHMAIGNKHLKRQCIPSYIYNYLKSVRGPHFLFNQIESNGFFFDRSNIKNRNFFTISICL